MSAYGKSAEGKEVDDRERRYAGVQLILDVVYAAAGIAVICLGIAAWLMSAWRSILIPALFAMAAVMCAAHGADLIKNMPRGKKNWNGVLAAAAGAGAMSAMTVVTYICLR